MKKLIIFLYVLLPLFVNSQELEQPYKVNSNSPEWMQLMYSEHPNFKKVCVKYTAYYEINEFVKNQHTQYYKRWVRKYEPFVDQDGTINMPRINELNKQKSDYNAQITQRNSSKSFGDGNWEELGPWEYDHEAAIELGTQSPGSTHVYTVEQSKTDPNTIYVGTASAGVWKSIDKGLNWELITKDILITTVKALAIDPTNENVVYFGYDNKIWKSIDGGLNWSFGDDIGYAREIKIDPTNANVIMVATTWGLYRSADGGSSWINIRNGYFYEVQYHPTNPLVIYAIKSGNNRTTFFKSIDGGLSFSPRYNGWVGVASVNETDLNALELTAGDYATLNATLELGSSTISNFSIELKLKSNGWSGDPAIFSNKNWGSGDNKGFNVFGYGNGNIGFNMGNGSSRIDLNGGDITDNEWHHVTITYEATGDKIIYVDGVQRDISTAPFSTDVISGLSTAFYQDGTLGYGFDYIGEIGEVRVFNLALSSTVVADNYCSTADGTHPNYANLIHHYKIEEGSGTILIDDTGSNDGTIVGGATWSPMSTMSCVTSSFTNVDEQRRTEIAVSEDNPNLVIALATGDVDGGSGLVGVYKSIDAGETFTFQCCGDSPGGLADITNKNIVGYSGDLSSSGGQYYYDLALDISPTESDSILAAGIMVVKSTDGGINWARNSHWVTWGESDEELSRYVHADVHDVKFFKTSTGVDLWIASDGGLYYSADQGQTMEPRMFGIQGTEFWGFGSSSIGDAMIGGAYHNGTLHHYENTYLKGKNNKGGWLARGAGDAGDGYIHEANPKWFFDYGGLSEFPDDRLEYANSLPFDNSKVASFGTQSYSNYEWLPNQYFEFYSAVEEKLWKTNDNGSEWELIEDFVEGKIYNVRTSDDNPDVIYLIHQTDSRKYFMKSEDRGVTWIDITPSDGLVGANNNGKAKVMDVSHSNANHIWCAIRSWSNDPKVLKSEDGGVTWTDITGVLLESQYIASISHQQGTDGGVYIGTSYAIYYKNNTMSDFILYNSDLPAKTQAQFQYPNYTYQKLRIGTYRGAFEGDFYEPSEPVAKPSVNKIKSYCMRDTLCFKDLSFVSSIDHSRTWSFPGGIPATSSEENPKVNYPTAGVYTVTLTVTDSIGTDTRTLTDFITITNECEVEETPTNALFLDVDTMSAVRTNHPFDFGTTDFSISLWFKTTSTSNDASIISDKNWDSGYNKGWILGMQNGELFFNVSDGSARVDVSNNSEVYNDNEWHYTAFSVDVDGLINLYVDGELLASGDISGIGDIATGEPIFMGSDNEVDYQFDGLMDEVKIWNTVISQGYFREQRHLTAVPTEDANLIAYYQFNRDDDEVMDVAGAYHAKQIYGAENVTSTAPLGGGISDRITVDTDGEHNFTNTALNVHIPSAGIFPNGEVVVTKIHVDPNEFPLGTSSFSNYWIINNYGENLEFTAFDSITFGEASDIEFPHSNYANHYQLYTRDDNEDDEWSDVMDDADFVIEGMPGDVRFSTGLDLTKSGQFFIGHTGDDDEVLSLNTDLTNGISIYPTLMNSQDSEMTIVNESGANLKLTFYNSLGQIILTQQISTGKISIDFPLSSGLYFMKFNDEMKQVDMKKIVVQ